MGQVPRYPTAGERSAILSAIRSAAHKWGLRVTEKKRDLMPGPGRMQWVLKPRYQAWRRKSRKDWEDGPRWLLD